MRLLIDLFACQSASRMRGLGRYAGSVAQAAIEIANSQEIWVAGNGHFAEEFEVLRKRYAPLLPPGRLIRYSHQVPLQVEGNSDSLWIASAISARALQMLSPDIGWSPSPFEGWNENGSPLLPSAAVSNSLNVSTVHDFIPLVFPDEYLERVPGYKSWYLRRMAMLHRCDLLVADSNATRRDALRFLGVSEDRIVTVPLAADPYFARVAEESDFVQALLRRFRITKPFILFTGNADFRKNVDGMLRAFSRLAGELQLSHQLVLTQVGDAATFEQKVRALAIPSGSIVVAGEVSDEELRALYSSCKLFVFPSLYEGFGIPLLEAMACGAPAIAGDNSSLPEIMGLREALFDASNPQCIADAISLCLMSDGLRSRLSEYGLHRSCEFTWRRTAAQTLDAMREALNRHQCTTVAVSPSSRPRIAFVSPLPPSVTGIADYARELLPHLVRHFDIDLYADLASGGGDDFERANFRIFDFRELPARYDNYASTVYQVGNSPFHTFMVNLLEVCPGVVVLHDYFLSNLAFDLEFIRGERGAFAREIDEAHGLRGLTDFVASGHERARQLWPMNIRVLRNAICVVAHSKHQLALVSRYLGSGWSPRLEFVAPPRALEPPVTLAERNAARRLLGVPLDCLLVCSFGFLATTKRCELIAESFASAHRNFARPMRLVFVGADDGSVYRQKVLDTLTRCGISDLCSITGYVDVTQYRLYLRCADLAVQLRSDTRGESSRTVLDCLANGLPTIVNSYASLADHGTDAVFALSPDPSCQELSTAIHGLAIDDNRRQEFSVVARKEIASRHSPALVAAQYQRVVDAASNDDERSIVQAVSEANRAGHSLSSKSIAAAILANDHVRQSPRLLIDVSRISSSELHSGIERVVSCLIRGIVHRADPAQLFELFRLDGRTPRRALRYAERVFSLPPDSLGNESELVVRPGDRVLLLDSTWNDFDRFAEFFAQVRWGGGTITGVVYDLIPIRNPHYCHEVVLAVFKEWLHAMVLESDRIICISKSVADDLENYVNHGMSPHEHRPLITFAHLGSDIGEARSEAEINAKLSEFLSRSDATFVTVGTIEPRKGHMTVLEAFEILWQRGLDASWIVIGREGWNVDKVMTALRNHRELGRRLLLLEDAGDADVISAYEGSVASICASMTEGFGLPIVEAARLGTPSIVSDIPVFREIGGEGAVYFRRGDAVDLAKQIVSLIKMNLSQRSELASRTPVLSWEEAAMAWLSATMVPAHLLSPRRERDRSRKSVCAKSDSPASND